MINNKNFDDKIKSHLKNKEYEEVTKMLSSIDITKNLFNAINEHDVEAVSILLLSKNIDFNAKHISGNNLLTLSIINKNINIINHIIEQDIDISFSNKKGESALFLAIENELHDITHKLILKNADLHHRNNNEISILMIAIIKNNISLIQKLIDLKIDLSDKNETGEILLLATEHNNIEIIKLILENGGKIHNSHVADIFILAIKNNNPEAITLFFKNNLNINLKNNSGISPLMICAKNSNNLLFNLLIKFGADINAKNNNEKNLLMYACNNPDNSEIIKYLIHHNIELDSQDENGNTALHIVIEKGYIDIALQLIDLKCNINIINNKGNTPLFNAIINTQYLIIDEILNKQIDINLKNTNGQTIMSILYGVIEKENKKNDNENILKLSKTLITLINLGAEVNFKNNATAIIFLCFLKNKDHESVNFLIKSGFNINNKNKDGNTLLINALGESNYSIIEKIINLKADLNISNTKGVTPLMIAIEESSKDKVKIKIVLRLINNDANIHAKDKNGNTVLMYTARIGNLELFEKLIEMDVDSKTLNNKGEDAFIIAEKNGHLDISSKKEKQTFIGRFFNKFKAISSDK